MKLHHHFITWWHKRRERFYRRNRWHLVLDLSLAVIIFVLLGLSLRLAFYNPKVVDIFSNGIYNLSNGNNNRSLVLQADISSLQSVVKKGEDLSWKIHYKNKGNLKIDYVRINLNLTSAAFSLNILSAEDGSGAPLLIQGDQVELRDIDVNKEGDLIIKASWQSEKSDYPRTLNTNLQVKAYSGNFSFIKEYPLPVIKIISDLSVKAAIYFHSPQGDQLGIGPVPPIVGIPTTYWLIVKAVNNGNELKDFVFSAKLPDNVELNNEQSLLAGKFTYNKESRRLLWQIDSLAPAGGDYIANFALVLTPSITQVGHNASLLSSVQFHAQDIFTDTELTDTLNNMDSSLPDDRLNRGQGVVIQ